MEAVGWEEEERAGKQGNTLRLRGSEGRANGLGLAWKYWGRDARGWGEEEGVSR